MLHYWQKEIDNIKKLVLSLGAVVEDQIMSAMVSLNRRDSVLANEVIAKDADVDVMEIALEEECLK